MSGDEYSLGSNRPGQPVEAIAQTAPQRRLRIGLLLDSFQQPRWVHAVVRDLLASRAMEIVVVVLNEPVAKVATSAGSPAYSRVQRWYRNRHYLLMGLYERLDRRRFGSANDPLSIVDTSPMLGNVDAVRVTPRQTKHCDYFPDEALADLRDRDLDVAIRLGFRILKGDVLRIARYGVWSFHHGDNRVYRGGPPAFWEVIEGADVTGAILQILTERLDDGEVLGRTFTATDKLSVCKNRANLYWKAAPLLQRTLEALSRFGPSRIRDDSTSSPDGLHPYSRALYTAPRNTMMARGLVRIASRYARRKWQSITAREQWFLAYHLDGGTAREIRGSIPAGNFYKFRPIVPPVDRYWADPFPAYHDGRWYVFAEEVVLRRSKGRIVVFEITPDGIVGPPVSVLERPYHLSYPFVFSWNDAFYMIPETRANNTVELYRASRFPHEWEFDRVLLHDIRAADATLAHIGDRWWMFANVAGPYDPPDAGSWEELHIYHAPTPVGPWQPHARNPVKSDVRSARPAGRVFCHNGRIYRPAQNCSRGYGSSLSINEILTLTPEEYDERVVSTIRPEWMPNLVGTHTINEDRGLTVVDVRWRRSALFG